MNNEEVLLQRKNKFLSIGRNEGFSSTSKISDNLTMSPSFVDKITNKFRDNKNYFLILIVAIILISIIIFL
jgi:hypothetical protein